MIYNICLQCGPIKCTHKEKKKCQILNTYTRHHFLHFAKSSYAWEGGRESEERDLGWEIASFNGIKETVLSRAWEVVRYRGVKEVKTAILDTMHARKSFAEPEKKYHFQKGKNRIQFCAWKSWKN